MSLLGSLMNAHTSVLEELLLDAKEIAAALRSNLLFSHRLLLRRPASTGAQALASWRDFAPGGRTGALAPGATVVSKNVPAGAERAREIGERFGALVDARYTAEVAQGGARATLFDAMAAELHARIAGAPAGT